MKIKRIWIDKYKNLENLEIFFETETPLNIIIGKNGSGKSNLLEAIALIFKMLYEISAAEDIKKNYYFNSRYKTFEKRIDKLNFSFEIEFIIDENEISKIKYNFREDCLVGDISKLPLNIYAYYSGINKRMLDIFEKFSNDFKRDLIANRNLKEIPEMIYYDNEIYKWFLVISFLFGLEELNKFLDDEHGILGINSIELDFKSDRFKNRINYDSQIQNFWKLEGNPYEILNTLSQISQVYLDSKYNQPQKMIIQNFGVEERKILENSLISPKNMLESLFSLHLLGLIKNIKIEVKKKDNKTINFELLSEGEKQFISTIGLLYINKKSGTIFLMDEPDTYLHARWQRDLIKKMNEINFKGQIFLTTHSPIALSEVKKENIILLKDGKALTPSSESYKRDIGDILEEIMQVSTRDESIEKLISSFYLNIAKKEYSLAKKILTQLEVMLSSEDPFLIQAKIILRGVKG